MKIKIILLMSIVLITACQNGNTKKESQNSETVQEEEQTDHTSMPAVQEEKHAHYTPMPIVLKENDSIVYQDAKFTVVATELPPDGTGAFIIHLYNNETQKKTDYTKDNFDGIQIFFAGVLNNYLFIDDGTGTLRDLHIIDMNTGERHLDFGYCSELEIKGNRLFYERGKIETLPEGVTPPARPDDIPDDIPDEYLGYAEKCYFDADTGKIVATGVYECQYFE